jgi:predicted SAM-dependent methyltransferase
MKNLLKRFPLLFSLLKAVYLRFVQLGSHRKFRSLNSMDVIKLELGSGPKKGEEGWTTVDRHGADVNWDLKRGLPLRDGSVDAIYSSHLLEHIPIDAQQPFLEECLRVLMPGGTFSIAVPNARNYIDAYLEGRMFRERKSFWQPGVVDTGSLIDQINYIAYMRDEHKCLFDQDSLVNTLKKAGFENVMPRGFDDSIDLKERDFESCYAIGQKG